MLSNNINFKIQLKSFGGYGYPNIFINYLPILSNYLTDEEIRDILSRNLLNLLSWWKPPPKKEKEVKLFRCSLYN